MDFVQVWWITSNWNFLPKWNFKKLLWWLRLCTVKYILEKFSVFWGYGTVCSFTHRAPQGASYGNQCSFLGHTLVPGADFGAAPPLPRPHESVDLWNTFKISQNSIEFSIFFIATECHGVEFLRNQTFLQLVNKFPIFLLETGYSITMFTKAHHWPL